MHLFCTVEDPEPQQHCSTSIRTCGISGSIDQTTDALESTQGLVQQPAADCHQATLLGIVILVAVGLILIIQVRFKMCQQKQGLFAISISQQLTSSYYNKAVTNIVL